MSTRDLPLENRRNVYSMEDNPFFYGNKHVDRRNPLTYHLQEVLKFTIMISEIRRRGLYQRCSMLICKHYSHQVSLIFFSLCYSFIYKMLEFYPTLLKLEHYISTYCYINNFCILAFVSHVIVFTGMQDY